MGAITISPEGGLIYIRRIYLRGDAGRPGTPRWRAPVDAAVAAARTRGEAYTNRCLLVAPSRCGMRGLGHSGEDDFVWALFFCVLPTFVAER